MTHPVSSSARSELAPAARLRVGINHGNFLLVTNYVPGAEPRGVAPDLGRELGRRLGVPIEFVVFDSAGKLADAGKAGAWDVAFLGNEPQRANEIAFTGAYLEIPVTYLVPAGSSIDAVADVDREGVRVAVAEKSAYDLFLTRNLEHAQLVRADGIEGSYQLFVEEKLEALAGLKLRLVSDAERLPGSRVLEGQCTSVKQSIGTPKGRDAGAKYLREFVEDLKASGFVARSIAKNGVRGVSVAPPTPLE
ncbi:MAG TPA: transporter substrate-binding domain-containing protein [Burkholderiales bacterium]|nr:transporter substrate-binding domain-containing protein [Burkholderiales bacterium]